MSAFAHKDYRRHVGRLAYIAADRLDLQYTAKSLARYLSSPCEHDVVCLKRAFRYIKGIPRLEYIINPTKAPNVLSVYSDSDWASDAVSRRSTSGCIVSIEGSTLAHFSRTQPTIALSSTEAEISAIVSSSAEGLSLQNILALLVVLWFTQTRKRL